MNDNDMDQFMPPKEVIEAITGALTHTGLSCFHPHLAKDDQSDYAALNTPNPDAEFITAWNYQAHMVHGWARGKGWWDNKDADALEQLSMDYASDLPPSALNLLKEMAHKLRRRNDGELIALCHTELSEMTEGIRTGNGPDDKIPEFSSAEAEAADVVIRLMDMSHARGWRIGEAIIAKMKMNHTRSYRHGGKEF